MTGSETATSFAGTGAYTPVDVSRLTGIPVDRIRHWLLDPAHHEPKSKLSRIPLLIPDFEDARELELLSFQDMHELRVIHYLRGPEFDWPMPRIRAHIAGGRTKLQVTHPLSSGKMKADFAKAYVDDEDLEEATTAQLVFEDLVRPFLKDLRFAEMRAVSWQPFENVIIDPTRSSGRPLVKDYFVPTATLARVARATSPSNAAAWYEVSEEAVATALRYEQSLDERAAA